MTAHLGVFSLIQYCPNLARSEGINVGIVVASPTLGVVRTQFAETNSRARRAFGATLVDDARLTSAKRALQHRLSFLAPQAEALRIFAAQEAGMLVVLEPRTLVVEDIDTTTADLFAKLVGVDAKKHRRPKGRKPKIDSYFTELMTANVPLMRDVDVEVPLTGHKLKADYSYKNGALNLIKATGFPNDEERVVKRVENIGAQGLLLHKHPDPQLGQRKLIIVGEFADGDQEQVARTLLGDFNVRLVVTSELAEFVEEVRREAHK